MMMIMLMMNLTQKMKMKRQMVTIEFLGRKKLRDTQAYTHLIVKIQEYKIDQKLVNCDG